MVYASHSLFLWEKLRNGGKVKKRKRDYSPLEYGFWGTQAQESVNLAGLRGVAGRGVLGGLIRRMLSHHPSRQAGENWLAPCRVEFTGGGGGGWCGVVRWIPVTAFGLFQDLSSKLIKYLSCFPLPAVAALPLAAPSPSLHRPFDPSDYCERWGAQAAGEWARVSGRNREKLQTQDPGKRESSRCWKTAPLLTDWQTTALCQWDILKCDAWEMATANKQQLKNKPPTCTLCKVLTGRCSKSNIYWINF